MINRRILINGPYLFLQKVYKIDAPTRRDNKDRSVFWPQERIGTTRVALRYFDLR
jgi:hypothetical protein